MSVPHGSVRIHSRYVRITPYSAAAGGSRSSRASSRSAAFCASSGSVSCVEPLAQLVDLGLLGVALAELVPGSPSAAGGGSTRAGPSPSPTGPATGSSTPSSNTSSSRLRIAEIWRSRCSTSTVSSSSWRSSVLIVRRVEATRCASALGSSTFAAASCSSSGRYGASPMMRANWPWTLRVERLDLGRARRSTSGTASNSADEVRVVGDALLDADALQAAGRGCAASRRAP